MNPVFFEQVAQALATERLDAYRHDGAAPAVALARYVWNMALCEALYSPLQLAEVALRNAQHRALTTRFGAEAWYDVATAPLPDWQRAKVAEARQKLQVDGKPVTPGRMVAELSFGFWTGFFNKTQARSGLGYYLARQTFPHAPRTECDMVKLDARWRRIRDLRNRVFHHERIIHWKDLDTQHADILRLIGWIHPELHEMALVLDRFTTIRRDGLAPWIARIRHHWPEPAGTPSSAPANATLAIIPDAFDASSGAETPFGHRWGGDVFRLASEHLAALQAGQTLALDVQNEYIAFLKSAESAKREQAINLSAEALAKAEASAKMEANLPARHSAAREGGRGLGYGG